MTGKIFMRLSTLIFLAVIVPYFLADYVPALKPLVNTYQQAGTQLYQVLELDKVKVYLQELFTKGKDKSKGE